MDDPKDILARILAEGAHSVAPEAGAIAIQLERPRNPEHGDFACNVALQLAKLLKRKPREIAEAIRSATAEALARTGRFGALEIAGAGFLNIRLAVGAKLSILRRVLSEGEHFGRGPSTGQRIQLEFVSANPTGPLHVGHGRGAAYGASLANVLEFAGHAIEREFYINDAGRQMDILALSVWMRYLETHGRTVPFPDDGYRGDYVRDIGAALARSHGDGLLRDTALLPVPQAGEDPDAALDHLIAAAKELLGAHWKAVHGFALGEMLDDQREDLEAFRVRFDAWFSERSLYDTGEVRRCVEALAQRGHAYEKDGALWFRSSTFGDEKDRVVRRENGQYTYFASDIAYHAHKFAREYDRVIDVWGADHHGYIARVKGALAALGLDPALLTVALVQFAVLYRGGEKVAMGKRSGDFVTLRELREEIGNDAARFFYVLRKSDQHLDFDLDLAKAQSNDNPVYYVQYAHARVRSVFAQRGCEPAKLAEAPLDTLVSARELALAQLLAGFPEIVQDAARELAPHIIAFYLKDLAAEFHSYYNAERILVEDPSLAVARLALCEAVRQVLANGLALLGVGAPERM